MITRELILETATRLFMEHGVKTVTINRIVTELHTSKRTIYSHFDDKTELLKACLKAYNIQIKTENEELIEQSADAIEAMGHIHQRIVRRMYQLNPNFYTDIKFYYPGLLKQTYRESGMHAHRQLLQLAEWGIKDGIFHSDMDLEVVGKTVFALIKLLNNNKQFPLSKYSKERLTFSIMVPYMRGLCTDKGMKLLEVQEELFRIAI